MATTEERRAYQKEYYKRNKEEIQAYQKAYQKAYYQRNKEKVAAQRRERRRRNKENGV